MAKCDVCGKGPQSGNNVSHANNKTRRRWLPNLQKVRVQMSAMGKAAKRLTVCTGCLKSRRVTKAA